MRRSASATVAAATSARLHALKPSGCSLRTRSHSRAASMSGVISALSEWSAVTGTFSSARGRPLPESPSLSPSLPRPSSTAPPLAAERPSAAAAADRTRPTASCAAAAACATAFASCVLACSRALTCHQGSSGFIRVHQGSSGVIWQGSSGFIRAHQGSSGFIRATHLAHRACLYVTPRHERREHLPLRPQRPVLSLKVSLRHFHSHS